MVARAVTPADDPARPAGAETVRFVVDGVEVAAVAGSTIAAVLLTQGRLAWGTSSGGPPRSVFCGIGVCFGCLVSVGGESDVRACQRRARDGDVVTTT